MELGQNKDKIKKILEDYYDRTFEFELKNHKIEYNYQLIEENTDSNNQFVEDKNDENNNEENKELSDDDSFTFSQELIQVITNDF